MPNKEKFDSCYELLVSSLSVFFNEKQFFYGQITSHHLNDARQNILEWTVATITRCYSENKTRRDKRSFENNNTCKRQLI